MAESFLIVLTTVPTRSKARRLAQLVLQKKLSACVNFLGPAESRFWWEGKIDRAQEFLLLIKTRSRSFPRLRAFLEKHHPYSLPEIVALPIKKGNAAYLCWLKENVR